MLWIVVAVNYDFTQSIMNMYILPSFTHKMLQELSKQAETVPATKRKSTYMKKGDRWKNK